MRTSVESRRASVPGSVSLVRLNVLRVGYLIVGLGNVVVRWPDVVTHHDEWQFMEGAVACMLAVMALLMLAGVRTPLRMLPIMVFEVLWKLLWLGVVALPPWLAGELDAATRRNAADILWVVVPLVVVPWKYVVSALVFSPSEPWRRTVTETPGERP